MVKICRSCHHQGSVPLDSFEVKSAHSIPKIAHNTFSVQYSDNTWNAKPITNKKAKKESGATEQFKVQLSNGKTSINARVKKIKTLNEALVYFKMHQKQDALHGFLPSFIGVFKENGEQIDLESLSSHYSVQQLCENKEYQNVYLMMNDLLDEVTKQENMTTKTPKDFKFVRKSLQGSDIADELHAGHKAGMVYKAIRNAFFSLSKCSFAFQKSTKSAWYTIFISYIKRAMTVQKTKSKLEKQFVRLEQNQLIAVQQKLIELRAAIAQSNYVMADSSLLFIPTQKKENDKVINDLEIRMIDMTYAFSWEEVKGDKDKEAQYHKMKKDMQGSIDELIQMVRKLQQRQQKNPLQLFELF